MNKPSKNSTSSSKTTKSTWQKIWHFIWEEDSMLSWIVNVILAFVLIKFLVYPGLGLILGTTYPVVAVVSGSMEHNEGFDEFWNLQHGFYEQKNISRDDFEKFAFKNGFNKGDIIVLKGPKNLEVGDVIVFQQRKPDPIIHRIVKTWTDESGKQHFQTKGDNNIMSISSYDINEYDVPQDYVIGKAFFRIPYFGWVKIAFVDLINLVRN